MAEEEKDLRVSQSLWHTASCGWEQAQGPGFGRRSTCTWHWLVLVQ